MISCFRSAILLRPGLMKIRTAGLEVIGPLWLNQNWIKLEDSYKSYMYTSFTYIKIKSISLLLKLKYRNNHMTTNKHMHIVPLLTDRHHSGIIEFWGLNRLCCVRAQRLETYDARALCCPLSTRAHACGFWQSIKQWHPGRLDFYCTRYRCDPTSFKTH